MSDYGRAQLMLPRLTSTVKTLIIMLLCTYVAQLIADVWLKLGVGQLLALRPGGSELWQLITYVLVDLGHPLMFVIGLLFLWWALSPFEAAFGSRRTWQLCIVCALGGSLPAWLVGFVIAPSPPLFGSHVLWYGGITASVWMRRDGVINFFGLMAMTTKQFLLLILGLALLMFLASQNHSQFIGVLGAMAAGIGFVNWMARPRKPAPPKKKRRADAARARGFKVIEGGGGDGDGDDDERPKWLN
ncbi:MAG: hypothetical protein OXT09_10340 [Myxococcales bacterium]|nr:hypothetical protein [Myxococcales bacterium]